MNKIADTSGKRSYAVSCCFFQQNIVLIQLYLVFHTMVSGYKNLEGAILLLHSKPRTSMKVFPSFSYIFLKHLIPVSPGEDLRCDP